MVPDPTSTNPSPPDLPPPPSAPESYEQALADFRAHLAQAMAARLRVAEAQPAADEAAKAAEETAPAEEPQVSDLLVIPARCAERIYVLLRDAIEAVTDSAPSDCADALVVLGGARELIGQHLPIRQRLRHEGEAP